MGKGKKGAIKSKSGQTNKSKLYEIPKRDIGFADKLSRLFYNWMKKKKTPSIILKIDQYEIKGLICEGSFGKVLLARNVHTNVIAAAKLEAIDTPCPQLHTEYEIYEILGCEQDGFIKVYHFGICNKIYYALIMELLGPDLDDLLFACKGVFTHKTVLMIALQTLTLIKHVHDNNIIYRDIKPENFCIGHKFLNKEKIIHIIDFGLSKFVPHESGLTSKDSRSVFEYLIGTARYMSINAHAAVEQSKRDDLESLGYMYAYFLRGKLPWMGLSQTQNILDQFREIALIKSETKAEELTEYPEFIEYINYVKNLGYMEEPEYDYLFKLINDAFETYNYQNDSNFDWADLMNRKYLSKAIHVDPDD